MNHTYVRYVVIALALCMESGAFASEPTDFFESKIRPLLVQRCEKCHGVQKQKSGLRLDSRADLRKGGERGPVLVPGKPGASLLIKAVRYGDPDLRMPPGGKLAANEIADLEEWVRRGAPDPRDGSRARLGGVDVAEAKSWWSLQPVKRPVLPNRSTAKAGTPDAIDAFISTKLAAAGLTLSVAADRRSLIRRATYDLTGLAPTPAEVDAFVADRSSDAFARVVERLLASRYYGERWGRHWLDLVRYADTAGENSDHPLPHAWRYRNWVIDAFNRDQAYDEFVREQIAGDLLAGAGPPEKYAGRVVAGGFLALARRFGHDIDRDMHLTYEDVIDTLGKTVLGLSLGCARCHDHKYDPVSMKDYYALYGIFESTKFSFPGCEPQQQPRDLVPMMASAAWERRTRADREKLGALDEQLKRLGVEQAVISRRLKEASPGLSRLLARGAIGDGKAQDFAAAALGKTEVKRGEMIQLSVSPLASHGADTTLIEWEIAELAGKKRSWNLTEDVVDELTAGNPHADRMGHPAVWCFLDLRDGPQLLPESIRADSGKPGLDVWRNGETPSVFVNATRQPIRVWTTLPPRSFFAHPSEKGPVGVAWISPIDGVVRITGRIATHIQAGRTAWGGRSVISPPPWQETCRRCYQPPGARRKSTKSVRPSARGRTGHKWLTPSPRAARRMHASTCGAIRRSPAPSCHAAGWRSWAARPSLPTPAAAGSSLPAG